MIWIISAMLVYAEPKSPVYSDYMTQSFDTRTECLNYVYWNKVSLVEQLLDKAKEVMGDRLGDETYTFARLVQVIANEVDCFEDSKRYGNLSVGVGTYGTVSMGDDYGDYFVDSHLNIKNHIKGDYQE